MSLKRSTYAKLLKLTAEQQRSIREKLKIFVPRNDYDICKVDFGVFLDPVTGWSLAKKMLFIKKALSELGITVTKDSTGEFSIAVDYDNANAEEAIVKLAEIDNSSEIRTPEAKIVPIVQEEVKVESEI